MITSYLITCSFLVFCTVCKIASTNQSTSCVIPEIPVKCKVCIYRKGTTTSAVYSCDSGYTLTGNKSRICGSNGEWEGSAPICSLDKKEEKSSSHQIYIIIGASMGGVSISASVIITLICKRRRIRECLPNQTCHCTYCPCNNEYPCCIGNVNIALPGNTNSSEHLSQQTSAGLKDRQASFIDLTPLDRLYEL